MIIHWDGKDYEYDPRAIDVSTGIKVKEHTGYGLQSWGKAIDDADPVALQALLWVVKRQNGEVVPLKTLNFAVREFFEAVCEAAQAELVERIEAAVAAGELTEDGEPDPTVTAD